jgi:hypothetical protein
MCSLRRWHFQPQYDLHLLLQLLALLRGLLRVFSRLLHLQPLPYWVFFSNNRRHLPGQLPPLRSWGVGLGWRIRLHPLPRQHVVLRLRGSLFRRLHPLSLGQRESPRLPLRLRLLALP